MDDDLFPDRAAESVGQEVDLVQHDEGKVRKQVRIGVEHVPQHFGRHDHDAGLRVHVRVAGEQAHGFCSVFRDELLKLLIAQRLHRRCVKDLLLRTLHGQKDREFRYQGLARTRGSSDEDTVAVFEGRAGGQLEGVQFEAEHGAERFQKGPSGAGT